MCASLGVRAGAICRVGMRSFERHVCVSFFFFLELL